MTRLQIALALASALMAGPALSQAPPAHDGHHEHGSQSAQGQALPTAPNGDWAYVGRDNPKPVMRNRWTMIPGESGAMYRSAAGMPVADRCRALLASPRIMVDIETRAACGEAGSASAPVAPTQTDHSLHR
jgi:hypothetical protein